MTDLPFTYGDEAQANPAAPKPRCRRHDWYVHPQPTPCYGVDGEIYLPAGTVHCRRCFKEKDPAAARRGKRNRQRGNAIEREIGKRLGLRRVGQYGGPDDLSGEMFAAQVKSGAAFSERYWSWLRAVPVTAGQTPLLVVTDAPGAGHRRRAVVVLDIEDWVSLHGPTIGGAA